MSQLTFMLAYVAVCLTVCGLLSLLSAWIIRRNGRNYRARVLAEANRRRALKIRDLSGANRPTR